MNIEVQIALVGGLVGLCDFCAEFLPQEMPNVVKLAGHNFAILQHEDYIIVSIKFFIHVNMSDFSPFYSLSNYFLNFNGFAFYIDSKYLRQI